MNKEQVNEMLSINARERDEAIGFRGQYSNMSIKEVARELDRIDRERRIINASKV